MKIPLCAATVKDRNFYLLRLISHLPSKEVKGVFVGIEIDTGTKWVVVGPEVVLVDALNVVHVNGAENKFKRDFDSGLFTRNTPFLEIKHKVASYMGEKLFMPRYEEVRIGYDGSLDPEYLELMEKSIKHWRELGDENAAYRFEMELLGMKQLAMKVALSIVRNPLDPARHIIGSDPGDVYRAEESKSVIFVGEVVRLTNEHIVYGQHAVPLELLELLMLYEKISRVADLEQLNSSKITSEELVAYAAPLIGTLNQVATEFGQGSWEEIVKKAQDQLKLENDDYGRERREELIRYYAELIYLALQEGRDKEYLNTIDESMRRVFALEAGADELLGLSSEKVLEIVERNIIDVKAELLGLFTKSITREQVKQFEFMHNTSIEEIMLYRGWMLRAFDTNPIARRALATGCGGGKKMELISASWMGNESRSGGYKYSEPSFAGTDLMQGFGYQDTTTEALVYKSGRSISITLPDGDTYTLEVREGEKCLQCSKVSGYDPELLIGPCHLCEHCDPNVHKAD